MYVRMYINAYIILLCTTCVHRFEMIKTAWLADSKDRPSFAIIVQIIQGIIVSLDIITHQEAYKGCQHHNIQNALMDETETTFIDVTNDGSYLDLLNSH